MNNINEELELSKNNVNTDTIIDDAIIKAGSQKSLASVLQCTQAYISLIKYGKRLAPIEFWDKVFKYMDLKLSDKAVKLAYMHICNRYNYNKLMKAMEE